MEIKHCLREEEEASWALENEVWPTFNQFAEGSVQIDYDPRFHFIAVEDDELVGTIDGIEFDWDSDPKTLPPRGWTQIIESGLEREEAGATEKTDWIAALGTSVSPSIQNSGLATDLLLRLKTEALQKGYLGVVAPVRPTYRWRMPDLSITEYADTRLANGEPFDPWLRIHERIGGETVGTCEGSAVFTAPKELWQDWSAMKLPENGRVLVPNAINYLELKDGIGVLREDSIWVVHR